MYTFCVFHISFGFLRRFDFNAVKSGRFVEFEWDETKRERGDYGEVRFISLGMVDDECFVVVHTERGGVTRLITA